MFKVNFTLTSPGMYSVSVAVYDKAQNYKVTRCLVFYDDQSKVEIKANKRTLVQESTKLTNYTWVAVKDPILSVIWTDRFINYRHKQNHWLDGVEKLSDVESKYDDHEGKRTVDAIPNSHGNIIFSSYNFENI